MNHPITEVVRKNIVAVVMSCEAWKNASPRLQEYLQRENLFERLELNDNVRLSILKKAAVMYSTELHKFIETVEPAMGLQVVQAGSRTIFSILLRGT